MALIPLHEPVSPGKAAVAAKKFALFALGFRPFYLLAALFSVIALPLWVLVLHGTLVLPLSGIWWHAHEMIFGFAAAVIVGFLFTAGRNWTGLPTPTGGALAALAALWLAGRLAMGFSATSWAAAIDLLFLPAAAFALARVLWRAQSRRNYFVVVLLSVLALANLGFHLSRLSIFVADPLMSLHLALSLIVVLETTIGGRVIPGFTGNSLRGVHIRQYPRLNQAAIACTAFALFFWVLGAPAFIATFTALLAASLQLVRCAGWNPWATRHTPLLWVLHLSHLWIPMGLLLLAAAQWHLIPRSAVIHALAIGSTGGLIIGMITRTALGHTGRKLVASRVEIGAYALVQLAAVARVLTLVALPAATLVGIHIAATAWVLAFLLYFIRYLPWLIRARSDGQPG
jgi:uncharacterized protein involved in response to NO